jgi:8-oxo-dGTP diphosphatase
MISRALILKDGKILMVKQHVQRGAIVWTFPGGGIEEGETAEQACHREVKEETGYDIKILDLIDQENDRYSFAAEIVGGDLYLNTDLEDNQDIVEVAWVSTGDKEKFDHVTEPLLNMFLSEFHHDLIE